jgi:hypothetical protein
MTLGEQRVQRNFNPSANPDVEKLKTLYANIIDTLEELKTPTNGRTIDVAQLQAETSCMYAVKSLFN